MTLPVSIDNGLSQTKVLYLDGDALHTLYVGSEVAYLANSTGLDDSDLPQGRPESDAWLTVGVPGTKTTQTVALGSKATSLRGNPPLTENKYMPAVYKTLGVLGCLAEKKGNNRLSVSLSTVLPYSEFRGDKEEFTRLLTKAGSDFNFRGNDIRVTFDHIDVQPEASGVALDYIANNPAWSQENILVFMLGHRDASVLCFEQGNPQAYGRQIGFYAFMKDISNQCGLNLSGSKQSALAYHLYLTHKGKKELEQHTNLIAKMVTRGPAVEGKAEQLREAISTYRAKYAEDISQWLDNECGLFLSSVNKAIVTGGTARFFRSELESYFSQYCDTALISWGMATDDMAALLDINRDSDEFYRMGDLYGIFRKLLSDLNIEMPEPTDDIQLIDANTLEEDVEREVSLPPIPTNNSRGKSKARA